jgi:hypothetical protein
VKTNIGYFSEVNYKAAKIIKHRLDLNRLESRGTKMLPRKSAFDILMNRTNRPKEDTGQPKDKQVNHVAPSTSVISLDKNSSENDVIILTDCADSPVSSKSSSSEVTLLPNTEPSRPFDKELLQHVRKLKSMTFLLLIS